MYRLPTIDERRRIALAVLLSPSEKVEFEFHVTDCFKEPSEVTYPVLPALQRLQGLRLLCFYGSTRSKQHLQKDRAIEGCVDQAQRGHHYNGNYAMIVDKILASLDSGHP
jgi:type IV secretory pathway VirJ component